MTIHNSPTNTPDPEVVPKVKRRKFSAEYQRRILEEANDCTEPGQMTPARIEGSSDHSWPGT